MILHGALLIFYLRGESFRIQLTRRVLVYGHVTNLLVTHHKFHRVLLLDLSIFRQYGL